MSVSEARAARERCLVEAASIRMKIARALEESAGMRLASERIARESEDRILEARRRAEDAADHAVRVIRQRDGELAEVYRALYVDRLTVTSLAHILGVSRWTAYRRRDQLLTLIRDDEEVYQAINDWLESTDEIDRLGLRERTDRKS
ncbi:MAG: hypothetical protein SOU51_01070 [Collinsella sp.]|nr:hypothetical protein [Collinsella sp.]